MYYKPKPKDDAPVNDKMNSLTDRYPTYGFWKMYSMIRLDDLIWNHKMVHRVYFEMGLNIRRKKKRRLLVPVKETLTWPIDANITWSMDFMQDTLVNGVKFRTFNVIDDFNREALTITIDTSISAKRVIRELEKLIEWRGKPERIRVDNGPEFTSYIFVDWAKKHGNEIVYIQAGKPVQNSFIERFNRTYRQKILGAFLFDELNQVRILTEEWLTLYNRQRPHDSLNGLTPERFLLKYGRNHSSDTENREIDYLSKFEKQA